MQNLCQGLSYKTFGFTRNLQTCKLTLWLLHVLTLIYWKTAHCKITKSNTNNYFKNMFKQHTKYTHVSTCIAYDSLQFSFLVIFLVISEKNNSYSWFLIISPCTFLQVFIIPTERIAHKWKHLSVSLKFNFLQLQHLEWVLQVHRRISMLRAWTWFEIYFTLNLNTIKMILKQTSKFRVFIECFLFFLIFFLSCSSFLHA